MGEPLPLLDPYHRIKHVAEEELPRCPQCHEGIQRPGVVWFGEELDMEMMSSISEWITKDKIVSGPVARMLGIVGQVCVHADLRRTLCWFLAHLLKCIRQLDTYRERSFTARELRQLTPRPRAKTNCSRYNQAISPLGVMLQSTCRSFLNQLLESSKKMENFDNKRRRSASERGAYGLDNTYKTEFGEAALWSGLHPSLGLGCDRLGPSST